MKCLRSHRSLLGFFMLALTMSWQITMPLMGATVYWDVNGNITGAGGASPGGTWDDSNALWNSVADGTGGTTAWAGGDTAVFAAGTDATGAYAVTVAATQSIGGLRFEEGTVTLAGGTLSLAGPSEIWVDAGRSAIISSALAAGPTAGTTVTKNGAGTLTLTGSNVAGNLTMVVNEGVVSVGTTSNLVSGRLTLNGGTLQATESMTTGNVLALGMAGGMFDVAATKVLTVATNAITGGGALTKTGAGTLTLAVASTYGGATTVNQGTLSGATFIPARTAVTVASGATIDFLNASATLGSLSGGGTVTMTGATTTRILTIGGDNTSTTFSGVLQAPSNRLGITKVGAGTLTLQLASATTAAGATTISAGTLALDFSQGALNNMLGNSTATTLNGGTLQLIGRSGSSTVSQSLNSLTVGAGGGRIVMTPNGATAMNLTTGALTATAAGGTLLIQAPTGTTVKIASALDTAAAIHPRVVFTDGTAGSFDWAANTGSGSNTIAFAGYVPLDLTAGTDTSHSSLTGSAVLAGARNTSTLKIASSGTGQALDLATQTLGLNSGGLLYTGADNHTISNGFLQSNNGELILQQHGAGSLTVSAVIKDGTPGATLLTKAGSGNLVLTGANTFTGGIFLNEGTLTVSNNNQLGAHTASTVITIRDGATFSSTADLTVLGGAVAGAHSFSLFNGSAKFDIAPSTTLTLGGIVSGSGGMTLTNTGTLVLGGAATFSGPAIVGAGATLRGGVNGFINSASGSGLTVAAGGQVEMNDFTLTVGGISGAGTITNSSATLRALTVGGNNVSTLFSGLLSGSISLTKNGAATLTLSGANTQTGVLTVAGGGTITVAGAGTFGASTIPVTLTAGILDLNGTSQSIGSLSGAAAGTVRSAGSAAPVTFSIGNGTLVNAITAFAGVIENGDGVLSLVKNGAGSVTLSGANTHTGGTQVNEGMLVYGNRAAQPATGTTTVGAGGGLGLGLGGAGFYSLADFESLYDNTLLGVTLVAGANVGIDTTAGDVEFSTSLAASARGLVKTGTNTLTLGGMNAHGGGTTLLGGTLQISSDANLGAASGPLTLGGSSILRVTGTGSMTSDRALSIVGATTFDVTDRSRTYTINSTASTAAGAIVKIGAGTLVLNTDINLNGNALTVNNGVLQLGGTLTGTAVNPFIIGNTVLAAGNGGGALVLSGAGTLVSTIADTSDIIRIGNIAGGFGSLTVDAGASLSISRWRVGMAGTGIATILNGATVTLANYNIGGNAATGAGTLNIAGGTLNGTIINGNGAWAGARYEQNIGVNLGGGNSGGMLDMSGSAANFSIVQNSGAGVGIVNLISGGTLKIRASVSPVTITTGRAELNFHGGTLEYAGTAANTAFISTGVTAVNIFSSGAIIHSGGQNITVAAPLLAPAGRGVASISASGSGYFTAPYVQITGGGGNNDATAVAQIDANGNISGIIITNPGTGYTSEPTVTLVGGTNETPGTATAALNVANVSGGLTKVGEGTLTLTGVNTYSGATIVNGGALSILPTSLPSTSGFQVGATGNGLLELYADGVAATLTLGAGVNITLGGDTSAGSLGFQLGAPGTSDHITFTGGGGLTVNAGGGHINAVGLSGFGVGSYQLISGASGIGTLQLGVLPSGYTYSLSQDASSVTLNVLALAAAGDLYWTGTVNNSWGGLSGTNSNWATTPNGATNAGFAPGLDNVVHFSATNASTSAFTTTLDSAASIKGLRILSSGTGAVTIAPGASSSLTIGSEGIVVQAGAPASTTISAPVTFGAAQTLSVADAGSVLTISGAVSGGTGNSNQTSPGTNIFLTITGAGSVGFGSTGNTFTGDILVDGGGFNVDHDRDWGGSTVASATSHTIILDNGGRLNVTGAVNPGATTTTNYNLVKIGDGGGVIDVAASASLSLDDLGQLYGSGALTKTGLGTFTLRNQNTFAGTITIAEGTLRMTGGTAFGLNTAGTSILSGATLELNDQAVTDTEPLTIAGHGLASAPAGVITNSAVGAASFAGPITLAADSSIGVSSTGAVVLSGAVNGGFTITNIGTGTASMTLSGVIAAGVGNIIQNSATSTLVLSGNNASWAGGVTIKQGLLTATSSTGALGTGTIFLGDSEPNSNNATLNANVAGTFANSIVLGGGTIGQLTIQTPNSGTTQVMSGSITGSNNLVVALTNNAGLTFSGSVNHSGSLTASGTGAGTILISGVIGTNVTSVTQAGSSPLTLSGNNLYTGLTTVNAGSTLNIGSGTAGSILGDVVNNGTLNFNRSNAYAYAGEISGSGSVVKSGAGTVTLSGANTYTGTTTISGGALAGNISANNLVLNGGAFETSGSFTRSLGTGPGQVRWGTGTNGGFSAQGGPLTVTLAGAPATLVWDSTTDFVSGAGQLLFGSLTADDVVTFTHDIDLNGAARTVQVVDNTGSATDKAVLSGVLSNGSLTKTGTGVLELTGANTYSGSTLVSAGTLSVSSIGGTGVASSNLGAGNAAIAIGSGTTTAGTLLYTGAGETTDRALNLAATTTGAATLNSSGTGALTWQGNVTSAGTTKTFTLGGDYADGTNVFSGTISLGTGHLAKAGAGTWELTGANTFVNTTISAGTLKLSGAGTLGSGTLTMGGVAGASPTLEIGAGITQAPTSITYTGTSGGAATITGAGTLNLGSATYTVTVADNTANAVDMYWSMNTLTGSGTLTKVGAGTLDISGITNNLFTGSIQVSAGSVLGQAAGANLILNGGVYEGNGTFTRSLGATGGTVQWAAGANGGFAANDGAFTVTINNTSTPALVWDGSQYFVSGAGALLFGSLTANDVVTLTNDIDLNGSVRTVQVVDNTGSTADKAVLSGVLSNGGLTKTGNGVLRLEGASTFTGALTVTQGTLEFGTVTDSGVAGSLGQGTNNIFLNGGTLSFAGDGNQSTNRVIATTASSTLAANGTGGSTITYTGAIATGIDFSLTLTGTASGFITGGLVMPAGAASADLTVTGGHWTLSGTNSSISDDLFVNAGTLTLANTVVSVNDDTIVTGTTAVLNLNSTGVWTANSPTGTSSGLYARTGGTINLNASNINGINNANGLDYIIVGDSGPGAAGVFNLNSFSMTVPRLDLGGTGDNLEGSVLGTGTLTVTSTSSDWASGIRLMRGTVAANLAGAGSMLKQGPGEVTLSGDNRGLTGGTVAINIDSGTLILDYGTDNNSKLSNTAPLSMRGGNLTVSGGVLAATLQSVVSTILSSGSSSVSVGNLAVGTFTTTLNLNAITRANSGGTVRFLAGTSGFITTTTANTASGVLGNVGNTGTAYATYQDGTGTYFATNDGSGNIVALTYAAAKNDVAAWAAGDHVTNDAAFTGTASTVSISTLRFNAAAASTVSIAPASTLTIANGGILQTSNVTGGETVISGGRLASGSGELIVTTDSASSRFRISSQIYGTTALTKTGVGTLLLNTANHYSGTTTIQEGLLQVSGGNAIGDYSSVVLSDDHVSKLELLDDETIGALSGGSITSGLDNLATVDIGTHRLTINQMASGTYNGSLTGSGTLVKTGASTLTLGGVSSFSGDFIINQGQVTLDNFNMANMNQVGSITLNGGTVFADYGGGTTTTNKIRDGATITLANTGGINGLYAAHDRTDTNRNENVGATTLLAGANTITAHHTSSGTTGTQRNMTITMASLTRSNRSTLLVHGLNLGTLEGIAAVGHTGRVLVTGGMAASLVGEGSATAGNDNWSILPWAVGSTTLAGQGDSFVTYGTNGFRPLNLGTEYEALVADSGITVGNNVRYSGGGDLTLDGVAKTMNSLLVENTSTTAGGGITLTGAGASLNVASGAFLFTGSATPQGITLSGFSGITTSLTSEYVLHVVNTSTAGVTINAPFTTAGAALTKSGAGTLTLTATGSTYTGATTVNQGVLQIDSLDKLGSSGSGGLLLNGGTLRFGAAFDLSAITVTLGVAATSTVETTFGGRLDTNGLDIVLANSIGQGGNGGLTKAGTGSLTLAAAATYTGVTTVSAGTLIFGVAQAVMASSDLVLNGGTLDSGGFATTMGRFALGVSTTLQGGGLTFTGNAEINGSAGRTLTLSHTSGVITFDGALFVLVDRGSTAQTLTITGTGDITINSQIVDGTANGALTKTGVGLLTLTGDNTYTGNTNVNSNGALAIGSNTAVGRGTLILGTATVSAVGGDRTLANLLQQGNNVTTTFTGTNSLTFTNTYVMLAGANNAGLVNNISGAGKALVFDGPTTANSLSANRTWTVSGSGDTYFNGGITSSTAFFLNLVYTGAGSLSFGGVNTALGTTTLGSATVAAGSVNVLAGSNIGTGNATIFSGALNLANTSQNIGTLTMGNGPSGSTSGITLNGGALNLGGDVTYTASANSGTASISGGTVNLGADRTFTINDSTATTLEMLLDAVLANGDATPRNIIKAGTGTLVLNQVNTYTGTTSINAGTLKLGTAQSMTGGLQFGSTPSITSAGTLDLTDASAVFPTLLVQTNSAANVNNLIVGSGRSLTINGNVNIGSTNGSTTTLFTASGGGSLVVNNTAASGVFQVGGAALSSGGNRALADLSGLGELSVTLNSTTGIFRVNSSGGANQTGRYSTLILPSTGLGRTTVTANILAVGDGVQNNGADVNALLLGSGENIFNVNIINMGTGTRDSGSITFNGATGSLVIRNAAGTGRATFNMGSAGGSTGAAGVNTFDVRGHDADLLLGAVSIGTQNRLNTYTNTFSFDQGILDMTSLTMATRTGGSASTGVGLPRDIISTMNLGGGTVVFQNGILNMASVSGTYNGGDNLSPIVTANLNISGGEVTIGVVGTVGTNAITMATASASSDLGVPQAVANINLTGGTTTVNGNIVRGNVSGTSTATATVTLNGGTLNMTGKSVGTATNTVNLDAQQGTLRNLGQLNGGGALTKTTAGLLVVEGTNTYTGATQVNGGVVQVGSAGVGSIASGPVNVASGATLAGSGTIGGATVITSGAVLQPGDVVTPGTVTSTITGHQTLTFTAASTALTVDTGAQIHLGISSPTQASTIVFSGGQFQYNGNSYSNAAALFSSEPGALAAWNVNPAATSNHDMIKLVNGTLSIGDRAGGAWGEGSVRVDGVLGSVQVGQVFNLIDWNGVNIIGGTFDTGSSAVYDATGNVIAGDLDLMALGAGYGWDVSAFVQYGIIVVVPEPSRALFMLLGLAGLLLRRRRGRGLY